MKTNTTRREAMGRLLLGTLCAVPDVFGASEFWDTKEPSAWSSDELLQLTTRSPWAKEARIEMKAGSQGVSGNVGAGPGGRGGTGSERIQNRESAQTRAPLATVRWESAQPVRDALKYPISAEFADHYVIGVNNLPMTSEGGRGRDRPAANLEELLDRLKNGASLQAKAKDRELAGVIQRARGGSVILFGFSRELLPLTVDDKDVVFMLDTPEFKVRAKFDPKEMMYRGMLAL